MAAEGREADLVAVMNALVVRIASCRCTDATASLVMRACSAYMAGNGPRSGMIRHGAPIPCGPRRRGDGRRSV